MEDKNHLIELMLEGKHKVHNLLKGDALIRVAKLSAELEKLLWPIRDFKVNTTNQANYTLLYESEGFLVILNTSLEYKAILEHDKKKIFDVLSTIPSNLLDFYLSEINADFEMYFNYIVGKESIADINSKLIQYNIKGLSDDSIVPVFVL